MKIKTRYFRLFSIIELLFLILLLCSCLSDKIGSSIADSIVPQEFDSHLNDPTPTGDKGPNEEILYETVSLEEVLKEDTITEDSIKEDIITELNQIESVITEDVIIEDVHVQIINNLDDKDDAFYCESYLSSDLNYAFIRQRIKEGASIVAAEVIANTGSMIINAFTLNWGGVVMDGAQIVVMAGGTTLAAYIANKIALAKSLKAGNSYEDAAYDALYEGANAFYYTAVTIDAVSTAISIGQLVYAGAKSFKKIVKNAKEFFKEGGKLADEAGNVIKKTSDDAFEITKDGKKYISRMSHSSSSGGDSINLYDSNTKKYMGTLKSKDGKLEFTQGVIPNKILYKSGINEGKPKFIFEGNKAFIITYDNTGKACKTIEGTIDNGGFIYNKFGQIIKKIDLDSGKEIGGFTKITKLSRDGKKFSVDVFGDIVEIGKDGAHTKLDIQIMDGIKSYCDSSGNVLFKEIEGKDGVKYLMRNSDNIHDQKVIGALNSEGKFDYNWKVNLDYGRTNATSSFRKNVTKFVQNNKDTTIKSYFKDLDDGKIEYIRHYGRLPNSVQIHHVKNVANFPDEAKDMSNLVLLNKKNHLEIHGGNYYNSTNTKPPQYIDVTQLPGFLNVIYNLKIIMIS